MAKKDRWNELCKSVEQDDGLPTRPVGRWTEEKLFFWNRYIDITTTAMIGKPEWGAGLVYVDLFAGPGICTLRGSGRRIPGSPLIAAYAPKPFGTLLLCEKDPALANACTTRLARTPAKDSFRMFEGDCNARVAEVAAAIPERALTLVFVDPQGLDAEFSTIQMLAARGQVDLLLLFADAYDVVRNVELYARQARSKLDLVLGPDSNWRSRRQQLDNWNRDNVRKLFSEIYKDQLKRHLGYQAFGEKTIRSGKAPLYRLIYASKHPRGLEFWEKVTKKDVSGQGRLDFQ